MPKKEAMKAELDMMVTNQIIAPVTEPTNCLSGVLAVPKKDGSVPDLPASQRFEQCN